MKLEIERRAWLLDAAATLERCGMGVRLAVGWWLEDGNDVVCFDCWSAMEFSAVGVDDVLEVMECL